MKALALRLTGCALATALVSVAGMSEVRATGLLNGPGGDWSGFYLGGHVGYGAADYSGLLDTSSTTRPVDTADSLDADGAIGGIQAGFNIQNGSWVWGVEGDVTFSDISDSFAASGPDGGAPAGTADLQNADVDSLITLRGRAGIVAGNLLFFATAGVAFVEADYTFIDDATGASGSVSFDDTALVAGGGVEGALGQGPWSWRVEGLYYDFDDRQSAATLTPDNDPGDFVIFEDTWTVRFALNYRFGGRRHATPVAAPLK